MASRDRRTWNRAAARYETFAARAAERRWARYKADLFSGMQGRILFLALGSGLDVQFFPPGRTVFAIDISEEMLKHSAERVSRYPGRLEVQQMDAAHLGFRDGSFEQVYTSCTFCSVSRPLAGLREIRRVLRPGGVLRMFEHTGSRWFPFNAMLHACTPLSRRFGPAMNRPTEATVRRAGFEVQRVQRHYLDVIKSIEARKPAKA